MNENNLRQLIENVISEKAEMRKKEYEFADSKYKYSVAIESLNNYFREITDDELENIDIDVKNYVVIDGELYLVEFDFEDFGFSVFEKINELKVLL